MFVYLVLFFFQFFFFFSGVRGLLEELARHAKGGWVTGASCGACKELS